MLQKYLYEFTDRMSELYQKFRGSVLEILLPNEIFCDTEGVLEIHIQTGENRRNIGKVACILKLNSPNTTRKDVSGLTIFQLPKAGFVKHQEGALEILQAKTESIEGPYDEPSEYTSGNHRPTRIRIAHVFGSLPESELTPLEISHKYPPGIIRMDQTVREEDLLRLIAFNKRGFPVGKWVSK